MPKISLKQKNHKQIASSIDHNIGVESSKLKDSKNNKKKVINKNDSINLCKDLADVKPSFPTTITMKDLIRNAVNSYSRRSLPNAFFAYRMALINEYRIKNRKLPRMGQISKIAKFFWDLEPDYVKDSYKTLTRDAKSLYKQNQIVLDKNMNYIKHNNVVRDRGDVRVNHNQEIGVSPISPIPIPNFTVNSMNFSNFSNFSNLTQNNNVISPNSNNRVLGQIIT
jgi:hypothetical protein